MKHFLRKVLEVLFALEVVVYCGGAPTWAIYTPLDGEDIPKTSDVAGSGSEQARVAIVCKVMNAGGTVEYQQSATTIGGAPPGGETGIWITT